MTEIVHIARCPEHGLHGCRQECFVCGGPVEQVPMVEVDGRVCARPECGRSLRGMRTDAVWCSEACRKRDAREHPAEHAQRRRSPDKAPTKRRRRPSGLQISYQRAVRELANELAGLPPATDHDRAPAHHRRVAADVLSRALSDRQRQRLAKETP